MPFNQRQLIEQGTFAYSPLVKAFEKQTKSIGDQGGKQIKATPDDKKQLDNLGNKKQLGNNELLLSKEREIFKNTYNKRLEKIDELSKKDDTENLKFIVNSSGLEDDISELELIILTNVSRLLIQWPREETMVL